MSRKKEEEKRFTQIEHHVPMSLEEFRAMGSLDKNNEDIEREKLGVQARLQKDPGKEFGPCDVPKEKNPRKEFKPCDVQREKEFYANVSSVSSTLYDVRLDFGRLAADRDDEHRSDVVVFMSPQHAKDLAGLMLRVLAGHEEKFGKIQSLCEIEASVHPSRKDDEGSSLNIIGDPSKYN